MGTYGLRSDGHLADVAPRSDIGVLEWLANQLARLSRERGIRRQIEQLQSLNDHLLRDIGMRRSDIGRAVRLGHSERAQGE